MAQDQNYSNHTRFDPVWHFFIAPVLLLNVLAAIYATVHYWPAHRVPLLWCVLIAFTIFLAVGRARQHSLMAQDRVIRLEEKLRYAALLPADVLTRTPSLTIQQIVALRFASDAELPGLVRRALDENLPAKQIKQSITTWRPDYLRV